MIVLFCLYSHRFGIIRAKRRQEASPSCLQLFHMLQNKYTYELFQVLRQLVQFLRL